MQIIDGKKLKSEILAKVKDEVATLSFQPVFCDVLVGNHSASKQYVQMKAKNAESVGIKFYNADFPESINTADLIKEIKILNKIPNMCGIIVQLPLPPHLDKQAILDSIDPKLDVDCLGEERSEKFYASYGGENDLGFPTAVSCMALLDSVNLDLAGKNIVVLGQGALVGKPVTALLKFRGLNPIIITRKTENQELLLKEADVIISGIGNGKYLTGDKVKKGVVLIDAGTSESKGGIVGDVDLESVKDVASYVSPVPGGVGPVTVAVLLKNVLIVAKNISPMSLLGGNNPFFRFNASILPFIAVFCLIAYLIFFHARSIILVAGVAIITWLFAFLLKIVFHQLRPEQRRAPALFDKEVRFSFPSEHSAIFASLGAICFSFNHVLGIIMLLIAFLIGISRAIIGVHFWRDILTGWFLGIVIALFFM